jgi:hypothetical protein
VQGAFFITAIVIFLFSFIIARAWRGNDTMLEWISDRHLCPRILAQAIVLEIKTNADFQKDFAEV